VLEEVGERRICIKGISAQGKFSQHHFSEGCSGSRRTPMCGGLRRVSVVIT
jgi:hypothetical protein